MAAASASSSSTRRTRTGRRCACWTAAGGRTAASPDAARARPGRRVAEPGGRGLRMGGMARPDRDPSRPGGRKAEHLRIAAQPGVAHLRTTGLDAVRLRHRALPGRALASVGLATELLGVPVGAPLMISAMTGGTVEAATVNRRLIAAAAHHRIALVLGSGRALLDDPALLSTYRPAGTPRPPLLLANLGAA